MNSKTNFMEVLTMLKKMKYKVNKIWGTIEPFVEGFFIGSGATLWFYVVCFGLYGLVTKQKMEITWVKK